MQRRKRVQGRQRGALLVAIVLAVAAFAVAPNGSLERISAATVTAPGPVAIGDTVTGNTTEGAVDTYPLFVRSPGATVVLRVAIDTCECEWSLTGPNGDVFDQTLGDFGPRWLAPGDYMLTVSSLASGSYQFDVLAAPAPQSFNTALGALVSSGVPAAGAGTIESPGAQDAYVFSVPSGGAGVVFSPLTNSCACEWSLRAASGPQIFDRHPMEDTRVGLASGTYSLRVVGGGAATGAYSFATNAAPAANRFTIALGDSVSNGDPGPGAGNLEVPGALDVYAFSADAGERVAVAGSDCAVNASFALVAPSGRVLFRDNVCGTNDVVDLPAETGDYELRVSGGTAGVGTYALQIAASSDPPTVTIPVADVFAVTTGAQVANSVPAAGAGNIEVPDAHDVYDFDGSAGTTVVLGDQTPGGCSGLVWSVYAPDGAAAVVDQPLGCAGSRAMRLGETGRYSVDVHGPAGATGTYSFVLRLAPLPQTFAVALGATVSHGVPAAGAGTIEVAGAVDVYTFAATRGQSVVVSDATAGGCAPIDAVIIAPDDRASTSLQLGCTGAVAVAAEQTGTFALVVTGRAAGTGSYSLRVKASPAAASALTVTKREGAVKLTWTPGATGGSPISNAQVSVYNASGGRPTGVTGALSRPVGSAATWYTFTGLTNGVLYRFVLREQNANGLGVPSVLSGAIAPVANPRPNILFILTDDQRYDAVAQLPTVDAQPGWFRFTNSFVNEPMCCPSRSTIFTGRYSHHTNVQTLLQGKNLDDRTTIATMLRATGYRTGFLGKYLNGYPFAPGHPVPPGWDDFEAYEGATDYYDYTVNRNGTPVAYGSTAADYSTDVWTRRASTFIRTADPAKPFFLEVAYNAPHFSRSGMAIPAPRHVGACAGETFPLPVSFNAHDQISEPPWLASQPQWSAATIDDQRRATCETLRAVDDGVAALADVLASAGRLSNTYIVLTSDNGYAFGEHSLVGKGDLFEESIRVPLIVRGPGIVPGTTSRLTSNVDLVPSLLALAKTTAPAGFVDGTSWAANARGATTGATFPAEVLLRGCRTNMQQTNPPCGGYYGLAMGMNWGLRTASWKYIEYPNGYKQLFDLVHDPHELRNLATDPTKAATIANLHTRLLARRGT